ncbi:18568_t:CDS:1, partial [Funneliformis geosporum]
NEHVPGIERLGDCYIQGIGTSVDERRAFELYLKAANMNYNVAQYNVAICFEDGIGTTKNKEKANEWYKKAAANGFDYKRITTLIDKSTGQ